MALSGTNAPKGPQWWGGLRAVLNSALVVALFVATAGYFNERAKNNQTALQAQQLAVRAQDLIRINAFQDSGIAVDHAFVGFENALHKGQGVQKARDEFLAKARIHSSQANELRTLIGDHETDDHLTALLSLQNAIRGQKDFSNYGEVRTAWSSFIFTRQNAVEAAKHRPISA